jgi:hypothetical protein
LLLVAVVVAIVMVSKAIRLVRLEITDKARLVVAVVVLVEMVVELVLVLVVADSSVMEHLEMALVELHL